MQRRWRRSAARCARRDRDHRRRHVRDDADRQRGRRGARRRHYGIYTYPGGGATYAPFETFTPLTFAGAAPVAARDAGRAHPRDPRGGRLAELGDLVVVLVLHHRSDREGRDRRLGRRDAFRGRVPVRPGGRRDLQRRRPAPAPSRTRVPCASPVTAACSTSRSRTRRCASPRPARPTIYVTSGGAQVHFADLDLDAATRITLERRRHLRRGARRRSPPSGRNQVLQGYATTLDRVTFTIGAAGAAPAGSTGTVAAAPRPTRDPGDPAGDRRASSSTRRPSRRSARARPSTVDGRGLPAERVRASRSSCTRRRCCSAT